jgi:hypothetical protein
MVKASPELGDKISMKQVKRPYQDLSSRTATRFSLVRDYILNSDCFESDSFEPDSFESDCGDSTSLSANSAGAVALDSKKSTLRNGDPGGAVRATAPLEFDSAHTDSYCTNSNHTDSNRTNSNYTSAVDLLSVGVLSDKFISDNLQDEYAIDIISHKRPVGKMREVAEWTIGVSSSFSWLHRSSIRAFLSWRAEGLARIIFPRFNFSQRLIESSFTLFNSSRPWGLHYRPQSL